MKRLHQPLIRPRVSAAIVLAAAVAATLPAQATVTVPCDRDNTMYANGSSLSNGTGEYLFSGLTASFGARRALLHFDVAAAVPAGSTIRSAQLVLTMDRTQALSFATTIHRVTADWGEGTSKATGAQGQGAPATTGDATWADRFFGQSMTWATQGGDVNTTPSATTMVGTPSVYTFGSTTALVADAQSFLDSPTNNFGWLVRTDESVTSAKRWHSRETLISTDRPRLILTYDPPPASVTPFGTGCNDAQNRALTHGASGLPKIGNTSFAFTSTNGVAFTVAVHLLTVNVQNPPIPINANSCFLYVDLATLLLTTPAIHDASGSATLPFPIPNIASLAGITFPTQIFELGGPALRTSNGLTVKLGS